MHQLFNVPVFVMGYSYPAYLWVLNGWYKNNVINNAPQREWNLLNNIHLDTLQFIFSVYMTSPTGLMIRSCI